MLSLWQMTLSASAVILLTALLRRAAADRLPRRLYVALWDIALLAGLIPFRVPWEPLSRLIPQAKNTIAAVDGAVFSVPARISQLAQGTAALTAAPTLPVSAALRDGLTQAARPLRETVQAAPDWLRPTLGALWLTGALILAAVLVCRWARCMRAFSEALPCKDQRVEAFLREHRLARPLRVRASGRVASPLSYGTLRPVILLPAALTGADDQTMAYVLTHEYMHIRAWDMLRKWALLAMLCLHWFNPLAWLMARLCNRDMELMCDERVVRLLGGRKAYCLTLLDMEVQRSNLTMGTCFSVTGIEERIKVMKNRKHQGILSIALAFAIFLGTAAGAMIGLPRAVAENNAPKIFFSRETWENSYAKYEPYGLQYDAENGVITYNGQVVRYFEDMWPVDEQGKAGACFMLEGGTIDVYGVREFPEFIQRNPDGSFDPSGTLIGLREATPEEYVERTARMRVECVTLGAVTEYAFQIADKVALSSDTSEATTVAMDVEWWTAEDFREWLEAERVALQELVGTEAQSWTPSTGWFTWTQEKVDEAIARYENVLRDIEQGALVSRTINGEDANMTLMQNVGDLSFVSMTSKDAGWGVSDDVPPAEDPAIDAVSEAQAITFVFSGQENCAIIYGQEEDPGSDAEGRVVLVAVRPDDAWRYTPEEWARIQELIDLGLVQWQEPASEQRTQEAATESYETMRLESWRETIAPYAPFGLSFAMDSAMDLVHLYWNGQEVRGVFDPERGMWITEHAGNSHFPDGAKELIAVYENGVLTGLREADEEENAIWDKLREESGR